MTYADFEFYVNAFHGKDIGMEDFPRVAEKASDYVRGVTRGLSDRVPGADPRCGEALRKAVCAAAEVFLLEERLAERGFSGKAAVASETVGNWSRSYRDPAVSSGEVKFLDDKKREVVRTYLEAAPCFRGVFGVQSFSCLHK